MLKISSGAIIRLISIFDRNNQKYCSTKSNYYTQIALTKHVRLQENFFRVCIGPDLVFIAFSPAQNLKRY